MRYAALRLILGAVTTQVAQQEKGTHEDEIETSRVLAVAPELVYMIKAVKDYYPGAGALTRTAHREEVCSASGLSGDATLATREKGEGRVDALIAGILP